MSGGRSWGCGGGGGGVGFGEEPAVGEVEDAMAVGGVFFGVGDLDDGGAGVV